MAINMDNKMNTSNIKSFSVYGLFGTDDIHIPFDENIKILVGENGIGKTQVLNLFYYTLTRNFFRLGEFSFDKLVLGFDNIKPIEITKSNVDLLITEFDDYPIIQEFIAEVGYSQFEILRTRFLQNKVNNRKRLELQFEDNPKFRKYPVRHIFRAFEHIEKIENMQNQLNLHQLNLFTIILHDCKQKIESAIASTEIMYFPTYRRVEEDLHNLGYNDDEILNQENTLIQFGMDDVQKRFNQIESTIDQLLKEGFSKITSEILSQLVKGFAQTDNSFLNKINENDIEIILARVGKQLSETDKNEIRNSVKNQSFENPSLSYILKKLVEM